MQYTQYNTQYTLHTLHITHYTLHVTHYTLHITHYTLHITHYNNTHYTIHNTQYNTIQHNTTQYTIYNTQYTIYITQYTIHNIHYTIHNTQYTLHTTHTKHTHTRSSSDKPGKELRWERVTKYSSMALRKATASGVFELRCANCWYSFTYIDNNSALLYLLVWVG